MKTSFLRLVAALVTAATLTSCATAYDQYGRPQQVVTPEGAVLGAAAVGLLAYGLASSNNDRRYHHSHHHSGYRRGYRHY